MSFPAGVQTVTVTGTVNTVNGRYPYQQIVFTPSVAQIVSTSLNLIIDTHPVVVAVDTDTGTFSVELIATDASGFNPTGWTYRVDRGSYDTYSVSLPADTPTVDLADITPVSSDPGEFDLLLRSSDVDAVVQAAVDTAVAVAVAAAVPSAVQSAVLTYPGLNTGVMAGGSMDPHISNPIAVTIQPLRGYIVNTLVEPPTLATVTTSSVITVQLDTAAQARAVTWFLMDSSQVITQQEARPTPTQRRTHLVLGFAAQQSGVIFNVQSIPSVLQQPTNQLNDLMDAIGSFKLTGAVPTANGANLTLNVSPGTLFSRGWNHYAGATLTQDPHVMNTIGATAPPWYRTTRSTNIAGTPLPNIDVGNYDLNGVVTPVSGGSNSSTNIRLWVFPTADGSETHVAQYGQAVYSTLANAVAALNTQPYVTNPLLPGNGVLIGFVSAIRTATNLSDPTQATISIASRFRFI